ncbi:hypothetical protein AB8O55_24750 [Saccharopolyspora cebuensis]|uniref:Uncharacterized protein n=1 Tax=Saccharopolyspora cebuensis TaxID=418759 RepID=A0ABV4CNF1_9PSEU
MNTTPLPSDERDDFTRDVDFGPSYTYEQVFDPGHPHHVRLPSGPLPSACYDARCGCESCRTEGRYACSPSCRFWRFARPAGNGGGPGVS